MQIGTFIVGHWELFGALAIILFLLARTWLGSAAVSMLMPTEAIQLINHKDALVVDVRTDKEYQQGHMMNALHIPLGVLDNRISELQTYKAGAVIMVCCSGARSGQAAGKLKKLGFVDVHNLGGGMMAWERANLPVTTKVGKPPKPAPVESSSAQDDVDEQDDSGKQDSATVDSTVDSAEQVNGEAGTDQHQVLVYTTRACPFCTRAIDLLELKGVGFTEVRIDTHPEKRQEMEARAERTSVPQIFIGDRHIGGCDDMYALEDRGELDALLGLSNDSAEDADAQEQQPKEKTGTKV